MRAPYAPAIHDPIARPLRYELRPTSGSATLRHLKLIQKRNPFFEFADAITTAPSLGQEREPTGDLSVIRILRQLGLLALQRFPFTGSLWS